MSRTICKVEATGRVSSYMLDAVRKEKEKMLTVRFDEIIYAEYAVATELINARSMSDHVHNYAVATIRQVRKEVTEERFAELVAAKLIELKEKGEKKAAERRNSLSNVTAKAKRRGDSFINKAGNTETVNDNVTPANSVASKGKKNR